MYFYITFHPRIYQLYCVLVVYMLGNPTDEGKHDP